MNIGMVVPGFSADASDWCIPALRHLARCLATRHDLRVLSLRYPYTHGTYTVDGAEVTALGGGLSHAAQTFQLWGRALQVLRDEHRRKPFDVLHAFWATESGLVGAIAGRALGVPSVVSLAGGELVGMRDIGYGDQLMAWERVKIIASLRLARHVTAGSRLLQQRAEHHLRDRKRVELAPLGVDTALFAPTPAASGAETGADARRIVHVGTLTPVKDQQLLLRAFAETRRSVPDAYLEVVGEGPLQADLRRLATELGLDGSVCFRGALDHAALPAVYRGAGASVVSSRHEAQCMVALEAAACGVSLVGTRVGVLPELTRAVAPVGDHHALAAVLSAVLRDPPPPPIDIRAEYGLGTAANRFRALYAAAID